jgi:hypothetical protein
MRNNPIPPGYPNWNTFLVLHQQSQEHCREILSELSASTPASSPLATEPAAGAGEEDASPASIKAPDSVKVATFYGAAMDEEAIERDGISGLGPLVALVDSIVDAHAAASLSSVAAAADGDGEEQEQQKGASWAAFSELLGRLASDYGTFFHVKKFCRDKVASCRCLTIHLPSLRSIGREPSWKSETRQK